MPSNLQIEEGGKKKRLVISSPCKWGCMGKKTQCIDGYLERLATHVWQEDTKIKTTHCNVRL